MEGLNPVDTFLSNLKPEDERTTYSCNHFNRGRKPCQGPNLVRVGPKLIPICRKHNAKSYEPAHDYLNEQMESDHESGLHGEGEDRKVFAERHEDVSGYWWLECDRCADDMASEELGVEPDQVDDAQAIKSLMESAQSQLDRVVSGFENYWEHKQYAKAVDNYANSIKSAEALVALYKQVLVTMELEECNMVVAYDKVVESLKLKLIQNRFSDDEERDAAASFIRKNRYW